MDGREWPSGLTSNSLRPKPMPRCQATFPARVQLASAMRESCPAAEPAIAMLMVVLARFHYVEGNQGGGWDDREYSQLSQWRNGRWDQAKEGQ